jgi:hypothetical protein
MREIVEKGSLDGLMWYLPVRELVECIAELNQQDDKLKQNIDEWLGTPDILTGSSDPIETATAQEVKVSAAHDRFKNAKHAIAEMARETLDIEIDLALNVWDDEKWALVTGYQYMDPEDQEMFIPALEALRNDTERVVRIQIDTDTTSYVGEQIRMQQRNAVIQTFTQGLQQVVDLMQKSPAAGQLAMKIMTEALSGLPGGPQFIDETRRFMEEAMEQMSQPPPEQPDYEGQKLQIAQAKVQVEQARVDVQVMKMQMETQASAMSDQLKAQNDAFKLQLQQQKQEFEQYIQSNYLNLDARKTATQEQEMMMEESRLAFQAQSEAEARTLEALKPTQEERKEPASNNIIINAPQQPAPVPAVPSALDVILGS